jgi:hypothetical protein
MSPVKARGSRPAGALLSATQIAPPIDQVPASAGASSLQFRNLFMKNPLKRSPLATAEDNVRKHEIALQRIAEKHTAAERQVDEHRASRRSALLQDPEADIPAAIRRDLEAAQRFVVELRRDRDDLKRGLEEARAALAHERERGERESAASVLETAGTNLDKVAAELHAAMAGVAKSIERLMSAIPADVASYPADHTTRPAGRRGGPFASPSEVTAALVAEALYAAAPDLFDETTDMIQTGFGLAPTHLRRIALHRIDLLSDQPRASFDQSRPGATAIEAARAISDQWRDRADRIRAGDLIPDVSTVATEWPKPEDPGRANVEVFATKAFAFVGSPNGNRRLCGDKWVHSVPAAVADVAVAASVALRTDTREGRDAFEARKEYRNRSMTTVESTVRLDDCVDLGDVLGLLQIAAE